jgi:ankyrin repeat protein
MGKKSSYVHSMILIILIYCLVSCAPTSSTGKTPEFYYKDSKIIKLCKAISRNDEQAVDELLQQGVDINAIGKEGMTPLWWAFSLNSKKRFEMVLKKGGNPNIRTKMQYGKSVMNLAVRHKDVDYLKLALKYGGNPNYQDTEYCTLLYDAIPYHSLEKVKLLYEAGADINHQDYMGNGLFMHAIGHLYYDIAFFLLEHGYDYTAPLQQYTIAEIIAGEYQQRDPNYYLYPYLLKIIDFLESKGVKIDLETPFKVKPVQLKKNSETYWKPYKEKSMQKVFKHNGSKPTIYNLAYPE